MPALNINFDKPLGSFAGSMITNLRSWLPNGIIPIAGVISILVAILLDIALFMMLYIMLPHGASTWRGILPGAVGAGLIWELAKKAFLFFISTYLSVSNLVYGSVAAIIAFLVWAYLSGLIFLFWCLLECLLQPAKAAATSIGRFPFQRFPIIQ